MGTAGSLQEGDKILGHVSKGLLTTAGNVATDIAAGTTAYATVKIGDSGATMTVKELTSEDTRKTTTFYTAQMDEAGEVYYGQMDITFEKGSVVTGTSSIDILVNIQNFLNLHSLQMQMAEWFLIILRKSVFMQVMVM